MSASDKSRLRPILAPPCRGSQLRRVKISPERDRHGEPPAFATLNQKPIASGKPRVTVSGTWYQTSETIPPVWPESSRCISREGHGSRRNNGVTEEYHPAQPPGLPASSLSGASQFVE